MFPRFLYIQAETAHIEGAKDPWSHCNKQPDSRDKQMVCLLAPTMKSLHTPHPLHSTHHPTVSAHSSEHISTETQTDWVGIRDMARLLEQALKQTQVDEYRGDHPHDDDNDDEAPDENMVRVSPL